MPSAIEMLICKHCECMCHWPQSVLERMAAWLMAPLDWAADLPTAKQRLMGIMLVLPIAWLVVPALACMMVEAILEAVTSRFERTTR